MDAMQHLVIDLESSTESRVDLTADELAERAQMAIAEAEHLAADDAMRADMAERRGQLWRDLNAVKDPAAQRTLTYILLRLGESAP